MADPTPAPNVAETSEVKAAKLVEGNPLEFEKALANATPTEKAALDAAKKAYDEKHAKPAGIRLAGVPGGAFAVEGSGFGNETGTVMVGGVLVPTTRWSDHTIRGVLPANVKPGDLTVTTSDGTAHKGTYGAASK
jgi:hypothetical protein